MSKDDREKILEILTKVKEIDRKSALKLYMSGIHSLMDLISCDYQGISKKIGESPATIQKWIDEAKNLDKGEDGTKKEKDEKAEFDPIKYISEFLNISMKEATKLRNAGVFGIKDLSQENPKLLSEDSGIEFEKIKEWINKAKDKYKNKYKTKKIKKKI
ncbi:MAG: hypothetical protein EAX96_03060 [Candidatus Lokiarchaeota archaeon]|nr:hypothetical protein [Candidatus Lokiarchaeota archaeon]